MTKALVLKIEFDTALFKVHYTKKFRLTYPIPLPTSVAGMFAAMIGHRGRRETIRKFENCHFGAMVANKCKIIETVENATFIQLRKNVKGVAKTHLLVEPAYYIAISHPKDAVIQNVARIISEGCRFMPYGGQNDYFPKDWKIIDIPSISMENRKIHNYLPDINVRSLQKNAHKGLTILPVMNKINAQSFYFITSPYAESFLISKYQIPTCNVFGRNLALYDLRDFYTVGKWSNNWKE